MLDFSKMFWLAQWVTQVSPPLKIDRTRLFDLIDSGKKRSEIAKTFGVTPGAITHALKEPRPKICTGTALENADLSHKAVMTAQLDTIEQLSKINRDANIILDTMMKWHPNDEESFQTLQKQIRSLRLGLNAMKEIREQVRLQIDIMKTLHDVAAVAEFQKEVIAAVGESNKCHSCGAPVVCAKCGEEVNVRAVIIENLKRARALRTGVQFQP